MHLPEDGTNILKHINPLNSELNPICRLPALLGAHLIFHVSGLRVNICIYGISLKSIVIREGAYL